MTAGPHSYTGLLGDVAALMLSVEEEHSLAGWDNSPPTLYRVGRDESGRFQLDPVRLDAAALGIGDAHPRQILAALAAMLAGPSGSMLESMFSQPPVAHLIVMEAWMRAFSSTEERNAERRMLADIPGSVETRWAVAVIGKHLLHLSRVRGKPPEFRSDVEHVSGSMTESMKAIHTATAKIWRGR